jgi:bifunctional non-homologous end joining protein LigD
LVRQRAAITRRSSIMAAALDHPAMFFAFDILAARDRDLRALPLARRKAILATILLEGLGRIRPMEMFRDGVALLEMATALGLRGIVAKHVASRYVSGRSGAWLAIRSSNAHVRECTTRDQRRNRTVLTRE